eukprot:403357272
MSSTTQDQTPDTSPAQNKIAIEKKKIKVLKTALKLERQERQGVEVDLKAAQKQIEYLKCKLNDEEQKYLKLYQENMNLQEALIREAKSMSQPTKQKSTGPKAPVLFGNAPSKKQSEQTLGVDQNNSPNSTTISNKSEAYEMMAQKCKSFEEMDKKREEDFQVMVMKYEEQTNEMLNLRKAYEQKLLELINERDDYGRELENKDIEISQIKRENREEMEKLKLEYEHQLSKLQLEFEEVLQQRNFEMDRNLKIEEKIDAKNDRILQLEKELQRKTDEVGLRKEVIDSMSESLMRHESESAELASKLVLLKNQIMDHNVGQATKRKYAGVKCGSLKAVPVVFEFIEEKDNEYNLLIESKTFSVTINFDMIDQFIESKEGKLNLIYYLPSNDLPNAKLIKKNETFECCENDEIIKVYKNIRNQLEMGNRRRSKVTQSFIITPHQLQKSQSFSPIKKNRQPISHF